MDIKDVRAMSLTELHKELDTKRKALRELQFKVSQEEHRKVHEVSELKKTIAQLLTVLHEQEAGKKVETN